MVHKVCSCWSPKIIKISPCSLKLNHVLNHVQDTMTITIACSDEYYFWLIVCIWLPYLKCHVAPRDMYSIGEIKNSQGRKNVFKSGEAHSSPVLPPLHSSPFPSPPFVSLSSLFFPLSPSTSPPVEVDIPQVQLRSLEESCKLPQQGLGCVSTGKSLVRHVPQCLNGSTDSESSVSRHSRGQ